MFARFGTLSRGGSVWMAPLLKAARDHWNDPKRDPKYDRNLAFVLGGLVHQACDRMMKPFLTKHSGADWSGMHALMRGDMEMAKREGATPEFVARTQELSAYLDAEVYRQVYLGGAEDPFKVMFMNEVTPAERDFEDFIRTRFQRALLAAHTLDPDSANMDAWLDNLFARVQPLYLDADLWVKAFRSPDPKKIEQYEVRTGFYNADDPTIRAARALHAGRPLDAALKREVYERGTFTCAYAEVLQTGLQYLRSASAYWRGETADFSAVNYVKARPSAA
mgnify:FL=1